MKILFISHRIPYPPNKGDKIRSFHFLKHLGQKHDVYLASLVDDPEDKKDLANLSSIVKMHLFELIHPKLKKLLSGVAVLKKKPFSIPYFYSYRLQKKIDAIIERINFDILFFFSSPTAEYVFRSKHYKRILGRKRTLIDLIDVDSQKWLSYAQSCQGAMRWVYFREAKYLKMYEIKIAQEFDRLFLVSDKEKSIFLNNYPAENISVVPNGVDLDFFTPHYTSPNNSSAPELLFTGVMNYWPNIDAVEWFVKNILPLVKKEFPDVVFYIVGNRPPQRIRNLSNQNGVCVTGYVKDVRENLARADISVIPLRIAQGIQNKVLESMAMAKPVVCTSKALAGIQADVGSEVIVADTEKEFADSVIRLLKDAIQRKMIGVSARKCVEAKYSWDKTFEQLDSFLSDSC